MEDLDCYNRFDYGSKLAQKATTSGLCRGENNNLIAIGLGSQI